MRRLLIVVAVLVSVGIACSLGDDSAEVESPSIVEVTRIVTKEIEVTQLVEEEKSNEVPLKSTRIPTNTKVPIATEQRSAEELRAEWIQATIDLLEALDDVERVNLVQLDVGIEEIEIQTIWASQDSQPEVSWLIVTLLAGVYESLTPRARVNMTGSEELTFVLTSYSTNGEYRYKSETDYETMMKVNNRSISYEDWILLANAGFR